MTGPTITAAWMVRSPRSEHSRVNRLPDSPVRAGEASVSPADIRER
jgi:hypothetical protein